MGEQVKRPPHEGVGKKPTTGKPSLHDDILRANAGTKPTTTKPTTTKPSGDPRPSGPAAGKRG